MTVESTQSKKIYKGNGAASEFPVPFAYSKTEDIRLLFSGTDGTETEIMSNYRVNVNEAGDTSVVYPVSGEPVPAGTKLTIFRDTPQTQIVDLIHGGDFNPEVLEKDGFDRAVMMIQELQEGVDRAVKVSVSAEEAPEGVMAAIYDARNDAAESAAQAAVSADKARQSEQNARASEALAAEARDGSCLCADRAEAARDVALRQAESVNTLMETELAKINAIVGANRDDQRAAVERARKWAEEEPGVPVDVDGDGNALFSARHWANEAEEIHIPVMSAAVRGTARMGSGLSITDGDVLNAVGGEAVGSFKWWLATAPPDGWIDASRDMGLLSRAAFPQLWSFALGSGNLLDETAWVAHKTAHGTVPQFSAGDGATTFRIPLLRKVFIRAPDPDSGLAAGGFGIDTMRPITGQASYGNIAAASQNFVSGAFAEGSATSLYPLNAAAGGNAYRLKIDSARLGPNYAGTETAPVHAVYLPIIKAFDVATQAGQVIVSELISQIGALHERLALTQQVMHVQDVQGYMTPGGTFVAGAWRYRALNTVVYNSIPGAFLANNAVTLPPGMYQMSASAPAYNVGRHQALLMDLGANAPLAYGTAEYVPGELTVSRSHMKVAQVVFDAAVQIAVAHRCARTFETYGFGVDSQADPNIPSIYTRLTIQRMA